MKRLEKAVSLIDRCGTLADIGCDHGYVSLYAVRNGLAENVWAADISAKSLDKARRLMENEHNVSFFVSDGFSGLPYVPSEAVILGMGGMEIIKIISGERRPDTLVLQPQNHAYDLRETLGTIGYKIVADTCICERGRYYDIIKAVKGTGGTLCEEKLLFGAFCDEKNPVLLARLEREEKKLSGYKQTEYNLKKLRAVKEVIEWQR